MYRNDNNGLSVFYGCLGILILFMQISAWMMGWHITMILIFDAVACLIGNFVYIGYLLYLRCHCCIAALTYIASFASTVYLLCAIFNPSIVMNEYGAWINSELLELSDRYHPILAIICMIAPIPIVLLIAIVNSWVNDEVEKMRTTDRQI